MNIAVKPADRPAAGIAAAEWKVRVDLAAAYRLVHHYGLSQFVYNHITARVPGEEGIFLINHYGLAYDEITPSNLVKVDYDGHVVDGSGREINPAGFIIHSCIHRARKDVACVAHTHSRAGVAVSCLDEGLIPLNQEAMQFHSRVAYHDYEGMAVYADEQARLVASLGDKHTLILRNHGLLSTGRSVAEAFRRIFFLEQACRLQMDVLSTGRPFSPPAAAVVEHTAAQWEHGAAGIGTGQDEATREWPALLRMLDRKDPSWRA